MPPSDAVAVYRRRVEDAVERKLHHDKRRAYLVELLRDGFDVDAGEVELEHEVRLAARQWKNQILAAEAEVAEADGLVRQVCAAPRRG